MAFDIGMISHTSKGNCDSSQNVNHEKHCAPYKKATGKWLQFAPGKSASGFSLVAKWRAPNDEIMRFIIIVTGHLNR